MFFQIFQNVTSQEGTIHNGNSPLACKCPHFPAGLLSWLSQLSPPSSLVGSQTNTDTIIHRLLITPGHCLMYTPWLCENLPQTDSRFGKHLNFIQMKLPSTNFYLKWIHSIFKYRKHVWPGAYYRMCSYPLVFT